MLRIGAGLLAVVVAASGAMAMTHFDYCKGGRVYQCLKTGKEREPSDDFADKVDVVLEITLKDDAHCGLDEACALGGGKTGAGDGVWTTDAATGTRFNENENPEVTPATFGDAASDTAELEFNDEGKIGADGTASAGGEARNATEKFSYNLHKDCSERKKCGNKCDDSENRRSGDTVVHCKADSQQDTTIVDSETKLYMTCKMDGNGQKYFTVTDARKASATVNEVVYDKCYSHDTFDYSCQINSETFSIWNYLGPDGGDKNFVTCMGGPWWLGLLVIVGGCCFIVVSIIVGVVLWIISGEKKSGEDGSTGAAVAGGVVAGAATVGSAEGGNKTAPEGKQGTVNAGDV